MDSGNNNPKQLNNQLPVATNTSIQKLGNLIQLSADVLKEGDPEYWYQKGVAAAKADEGEKQAFHFFSRCILLNPKHGKAYRRRSYLNADRYARINDLNRALEYLTNPMDREDALYIRGLAKKSIEDFDGAVKDFKECILIGGEIELEEFYYHIIDSKYKQGNLRDAIAESEVAISNGIAYSHIYSQRSDIKIELNDYTGALVDLCVAITLDPNRSLLYKKRAWLHSYLGNTDKEQADLNIYNELKSKGN